MNLQRHGDDNNNQFPNFPPEYRPDSFYNTKKQKIPASGKSLKEHLLSLRETGSKLVQEGRLLEGTGCYGSMFNLFKTMGEPDGIEFINVFHESMEELNKIAMKYIQNNDTESGHQILTFCEECTQTGKYGTFPLLRTKTFNNIACLYRRVNKPKGALNYLRSALTILGKNNLMKYSAVTYLNLSAVQSQLGDHQQALQNAKNALIYAQEELVLDKEQLQEDRDKLKEKVVTLAIAYHNMGSEEEHLNNLKNAVGWYEKSFLVMDEYQIGDEKLYKKFQTIHLAVLDKLTISEMQGTKRNFSPLGNKRSRHSISAKDSISSSFTDYSPQHSPIRPQNPPKRGSVDVHHRKPTPQGFSLRMKKSRSQQKEGKPSKPIIMYSNFSNVNPHAPISRPSSTTSMSRHNVMPLSKTHAGAFQNSSARSPIKASPEKQIAHSAGFSPGDADYKSDHFEPDISPSRDSPRNLASEADEIKALEDMGILEWSDSDTESKRQKIDKQEIKKNQKHFFEHLKDANVKNLSGQFKLMTTSSSASSSSSRSSSEEKKKKKKKNKKAKKDKKEKEEKDKSKSKSKLKDSKEKKNAEEIDEDLVEDIKEASSLSIISDQVHVHSANRSRLDHTNKSGEKAVTTKLGQEIKSPQGQKRTEAGIMSKGTRLSVADKSKFGGGMQSFSYINPNMQSQGVFSEESDTGEGDQGVVTPPVKLTKEQLKAQAKEREEAAIMIQKNYKGKLARDRSKILKEYKKRMGGKYLIQKRWLLLKPKKTVGKKTVDAETHDYSLNVLVDPETEHLLFYLNDCSEKVKYDIEVSYADKPLRKTEKTTSLVNHKILSAFADETVKRFMIVDHLLLLAEVKEEEQEIQKDVLQKFSTFGGEGKDDIHNRSDSSSDAGKKAKKGKPEHYNQHIDKIAKIQSYIKGYIQRTLFKLRKEQRWKFLFKQATKVDDQLISFKLMQSVWEKKYYVTATHVTNNKNFMRLEVPPKLIDSLQGNYSQLVNKFEFDFATYVIRFMPAVEAMLFPETRKKHIAKYETDVIIKIQRNIRRYLARQMYKLMLKRARKNPTMKLLKKYRITKNNAVFSVLMYYNTEYNTFVIHAKSQGYLAQIKPLSISVGEVDKYDLRSNLANIRRLNDIIQPYVTIEKTRENVYMLNFNKKDYERVGRRFETQLSSYTDLDILGEHREGDNMEEVHNKVWRFLQDKNYLDSNQHILKNIMGLQSVSDSVKIMEELEPAIKQLGKAENSAAMKIQKKYRRWTFKKNCKVLLQKQQELMNQKSISTIMTNSIRDKTYSMFSKIYQRWAATEEELKRESNAEVIYVKSVSDVSFRNTPLEAKVHVFHNKKNQKEKTIDFEVIMPIIGLHQIIQVPENQILSKSSSFFKKIDENRLGRLLEFDEKQKKVLFNGQARNISDSEVFETLKNEINPYVQAKLARLKYLKRRMKEKFMLFLKAETVRVGDSFIHMTYYWHLMRRQLRIVLEQIDNLTYEKEIVVKFDSLYNSSELRGLVNDLNIQPNEFVRKINPYLFYISHHIIIQPGTEATHKEFTILIDASVLQLVFSNSKFVLTSFRDMSSTILNDIATSGVKAVQAHLKYISKTAKMTNVKEFEKKFSRKPRFAESTIPRTESIEKPIELEKMDSSFTRQKSIFIHEVPERDLAREMKKATLTIQKRVKGYLTRQMYNFKKLSKAVQNKKSEVSGNKVKKTIKKIDNQYWTITISKKIQHDVGVTIYFFTAVNVSDNAKKAKTVAKGQFRTNNMILVNSEGKDLAEFLLDRIEINGQTIEFNLNFENATNYVKIDPTTKNQDHIRTTEPDEEVKEVQAPRPQARQDAGAAGAAGAAGEGFGSTEKQKIAVTEPQDNNLLFPMAMHVKGSDPKLLKAESQPKITQPENLLQQKAESILNNLLLYNVYYNQDQSSLDSVISPLIRDPQNTPEDVKALLRQGSLKRKDNTVKIDVELAELKKYLPHLAPKSIQDLKQIAGELANSIQINEKGEVLVNHAKLNPNVLSVLEKKLGVIESKDAKSPEKNKNSKKKVLFKMTKAYGEKKYLLLINYIEKLSTINDVLTLTGREEDQVYEEFEMFLEISALCLSNSTLPPLIWELSLQEAQRLSGQTNLSDISKFFVNNLHIYGDRFLLVTRSKVYANNPSVISMNEKVIKVLQNKFRSRKFINNFKHFKENLYAVRHKIVTRAMISINNVSYHVFGYEKSGSELEVELWDLLNYEKYNLVINRKIIEKLYSKDKKAAFDCIFKFLTFEIDKKKGYGAILKDKELAGYLSKHKFN